ncbi:MAG: saccharopine dehydrogenase [Bacteroidetes bacterium]|nr:MAG: saccharopine dehydrogenase [Bacteroidota bacterium]
MNRTYDVIVWGATGFTGRLVAAYLLRQYGLDQELKWAVAGRNPQKLAGLKADLKADTLPVIVADSLDRPSLDAMVVQTRVVCSCTGPYALYGSELVAACVAAGTHYCDLSGEVQWMRRMVDQHHEAAAAQGVRIVHSCGYDSIPSDMGVFFLQQEAMAQQGAYCRRIQMRVAGSSGGFSGGTLASLSQVLVEIEADPAVAEVMADPYALNPPGERQGPDGPDPMDATYDPVARAWSAPFVMSSINTRIVRRSHALRGYPYGRDFGYEEALLTGRGLRGRLMAGTMAWGMGLVQRLKPDSMIKRLMDRFLPKPGEGPDQQAREKGFFNIRFYGQLPDETWLQARVTGDQDPGYGSTSKMLGESAVCLALDQAQLPPRAGVLTPVSAMGEVLLARLQARAGLTFQMKD